MHRMGVWPIRSPFGVTKVFDRFPSMTILTLRYLPVIRLEWLHARASEARWWEEKTLLIEELRRVGVTFKSRRATWKELANKTDWGKTPSEIRAGRGIMAYAEKQAAMYRSLAQDAEARLERACRRHPVAKTKLRPPTLRKQTLL